MADRHRLIRKPVYFRCDLLDHPGAGTRQHDASGCWADRVSYDRTTAGSALALVMATCAERDGGLRHRWEKFDHLRVVKAEDGNLQATTRAFWRPCGLLAGLLLPAPRSCCG